MILSFTELLANIDSNAGNPFNRFDQQEINQALRLIPRGFFVWGIKKSPQLLNEEKLNLLLWCGFSFGSTFCSCESYVSELWNPEEITLSNP
nr:MAG TPA: hypothetical protein [Caudoviricetes sp.]DAJ09566.1 MAG TPA: hypothetical protein [Caudoviricetes sp.]